MLKAKDKYSSIDSKKAEHRCTTHPHNIILEILSEQGILGIILFSSILLVYQCQIASFR